MPHGSGAVPVKTLLLPVLSAKPYISLGQPHQLGLYMTAAPTRLESDVSADTASYLILVFTVCHNLRLLPSMFWGSARFQSCRFCPHTVVAVKLHMIYDFYDT